MTLDATYNQEAPFAIQIEFTQGCNLRCSFCGINGITDKPMEFDFMTMDNLLKIAIMIKESGWNPRIELAMHGEPTSNPAWIAMISALRTILGDKTPIMLTTNGYGFLYRNGKLMSREDQVDAIRTAKSLCNVIALDCYEYANIYKKVWDILKEEKIAHSWYPEESEANPHKRRSWYENDFVLVKDISEATKGTHSTLNNHCGTAGPLNDKAKGKRCAKPFRELSIRYDGQVALCCNDWRGTYDCGNVLTEGNLGSLWDGGQFYAARARLYQGDREFGPCQGCDATSYRNGLLPDKKGKLEHPSPCDVSDGIILSCSFRDPMTKTVKRPWE